MSEQLHIGDEWAAAGSRAVGQCGIDMADANLSKRAVRNNNRHSCVTSMTVSGG